MENVEIRDDMIRLGQLLKLAGLAEDGGHARVLVETGAVTVDGSDYVNKVMGEHLRIRDVAMGKRLPVNPIARQVKPKLPTPALMPVHLPAQTEEAASAQAAPDLGA